MAESKPKVGYEEGFDWSLLRHALFNECRRKYYYHYYGSRDGWRKEAPYPSSHLYSLKTVKERRVWIGLMVHREIRRILKELSSTGSLKPPSVTLTRLTRTMRMNWMSSKTGSWKEEKVRLYEHEYGIPSSRDDWKKAHALALRCLMNFYRSTPLRMLKEGARALYIERQRPARFSMLGIRFLINLNLALFVPSPQQGGQVFIANWNTGASAHDRLHYVMQAIFISHKTGTKPENIKVIECRLNEGTETLHTFSQADINDAKVKVIASVAEQRALLPGEGKEPSPLTFQKTRNIKKCRACSFYMLCSFLT